MAVIQLSEIYTKLWKDYSYSKRHVPHAQGLQAVRYGCEDGSPSEDAAPSRDAEVLPSHGNDGLSDRRMRRAENKTM